jgi:hypothetical protein
VKRADCRSTSDSGCDEFPALVHFVGFRGEEYWSAVRVYGLPDVIHRWHDERCLAEQAAGDIVVWANQTAHRVTEYTYDDSANEALTTLPGRNRYNR